MPRLSLLWRLSAALAAVALLLVVVPPAAQAENTTGSTSCYYAPLNGVAQDGVKVNSCAYQSTGDVWRVSITTGPSQWYTVTRQASSGAEGNTVLNGSTTSNYDIAAFYANENAKTPPAATTYRWFVWKGFSCTSTSTSGCTKLGEIVPGKTPPPPPETASACGTNGYVGVKMAFADGALDWSWRWKGGLPARGWKVTDAAISDAAGAGATLVTIPTTPVAGSTSRYGLVAWTVPPGVDNLRVTVGGKSECFLSAKVTRDANGVVTAVGTVGSQQPDLSAEPPPATDDDGADCGMFPPDIPCILEYLFVPDPESWGFSSFLDTVTTKPPFSVAIQVVDSIKAAVSAFTSSVCGGLPLLNPNVTQNQDGSQYGGFSCQRSQPVQILYGVVSAGLLGVTAVAIFKVLQGAWDR